MIEGLKEEISSLTQLLEAGQGLSVEEQNAMDELTRQRDALTKERNAQVSGTHQVPQALCSCGAKFAHPDMCPGTWRPTPVGAGQPHASSFVPLKEAGGDDFAFPGMPELNAYRRKFLVPPTGKNLAASA